MVLFLNKIDVFSQKLAYSPLENYFPDYSGGADLNKAVKYILYRFQQVNRSGLKIYPHVTCATDTSNIKLVMGAVKATILENSLKTLVLIKSQNKITLYKTKQNKTKRTIIGDLMDD